MEENTEKKDHGQEKDGIRTKAVLSGEVFIFLIIFSGIFVYLCKEMGGINMLNTLMNTSYRLLMDTVLYIIAIAVLAGAFSGLLTEFGVVALINKIISPLMKPLYGLPGASIVGVVATYFSDNPAILTLAGQKGFRRYFRKYQLPALTNLGTAFGMGLIITTFMISIKAPSGVTFIMPAVIGNLAAIIGSIISVRIMLHFTKKEYGTTDMCSVASQSTYLSPDEREIRRGSVGNRILGALLDGGKSGVDMGLTIIPGVLVICTFVLMLTNGPSESGAFTGAAYEGVGLLPMIGEKIQFILSPLFGFTDPRDIAVPITALGSAGAAIGLVPGLVDSGMAMGNEIAVFTAMCMCWSGYLSTHVAMMDSLGCSKLTGKAIISHTIGGLCAGISAHFIFMLTSAVL